MMWRALWLGTVLMASGCVNQGLAHYIVRPIRLPVVGTPKEVHRAFSVKTGDGVTLRGWHFPVEHSRGTVVLLHGKDTNRQHLLAGALPLLNDGFSLVAYDQRGHGASDAVPISYGVREVGDVTAVLDALQLQAPVYLVGESLGASVSLQAAPVEPRIRGVVAAASFTDLRTLLSEKTPFFFSDAAKADTFRLAELEGQFDVDAASPILAAPRITVPTLLLHGQDDTFIPIAHSERLRDAITAPRRLARLEGVAHIDVLQHAAVWATVREFLLSL